MDSESTDQTEDRNDVYKQIQMLDDLRERGILTDAEFDAEKKQLLDGN